MSVHISDGSLLRSELFSTNEIRKCYMIKHSEINTGL